MAPATPPFEPLTEPRAFAAPEPEAVASAHQVRKVRWHTGMSQADFAAAYRIDLDRLQRLELGRVEPDPALAAYLSVIGRAPELVEQALGAGA